MYIKMYSAVHPIGSIESKEIAFHKCKLYQIGSKESKDVTQVINYTKFISIRFTMHILIQNIRITSNFDLTV